MGFGLDGEGKLQVEGNLGLWVGGNHSPIAKERIFVGGMSGKPPMHTRFLGTHLWEGIRHVIVLRGFGRKFVRKIGRVW